MELPAPKGQVSLAKADHASMSQSAAEKGPLTRCKVRGGLRCLKPPSGARLTDVANFISALRSFMPISSTTCHASHTSYMTEEWLDSRK
jgi:hypothetical protein